MKLVTGIMLTLLAATIAFADDQSATAKLNQAKELFKGRPANIENALNLLAQAVKEAQNADLKYDVLTEQSYVQYFKGTQTQTDTAKMVEFEKAYSLAASAKAINDSYADAYYYYGIALARWAEAKGIIASLSRKQELIDNMEGAQQRDARNGKSGDTLDGYGPDRVLGRMYFKLPGFAGGSQDKSLKNLNRAYTNGRENALNWVYYAETLLNGKADQVAQGCGLLKTLLATDPKTLNPERLFEMQEEYATAKTLQQKCR